MVIKSQFRSMHVTDLSQQMVGRKRVILALDLLKELEEIGVKTVIYTDILKDGMMQGPNFQELEMIDEASSIDIIASGGVSTKDDIDQLRGMNLYGAIIGKALYEGKLIFRKINGGQRGWQVNELFHV